jgi:hypothetical protein
MHPFGAARALPKQTRVRLLRSMRHAVRKGLPLVSCSQPERAYLLSHALSPKGPTSCLMLSARKGLPLVSCSQPRHMIKLQRGFGR